MHLARLAVIARRPRGRLHLGGGRRRLRADDPARLGNATAGDALLLQIIAATVIGGTSLLGGFGGVWRTLTGAFIVGLTNALGIVGLASWNQDVIVGLVVIFVSGLALFLGRFTARRR